MRDDKNKKYRDILGVEEKASSEDINLTYRKLAKKCHPDLNKNDPSAQTKFIELHKAHNALIDSQKKESEEKFKTSNHRSNFNEFYRHEPFHRERDFFSPFTEHKTVPLSEPEPFVDLREIIRQRKRGRRTDFFDEIKRDFEMTIREFLKDFF